jgi:hypothetical protein
MQGGLLNPSTTKRSILPPELSKTGQITPQAVLNGDICYSNAGCYSTSGFVFFFFLFWLNL